MFPHMTLSLGGVRLLAALSVTVLGGHHVIWGLWGAAGGLLGVGEKREGEIAMMMIFLSSQKG